MPNSELGALEEIIWEKTAWAPWGFAHNMIVNVSLFSGMDDREITGFPGGVRSSILPATVSAFGDANRLFTYTCPSRVIPAVSNVTTPVADDAAAVARVC